MFQTDYFISGVAPFGEHELVVLAYAEDGRSFEILHAKLDGLLFAFLEEEVRATSVEMFHLLVM